MPVIQRECRVGRGREKVEEVVGCVRRRRRTKTGGVTRGDGGSSAGKLLLECLAPSKEDEEGFGARGSRTIFDAANFLLHSGARGAGPLREQHTRHRRVRPSRSSRLVDARIRTRPCALAARSQCGARAAAAGSASCQGRGRAVHPIPVDCAQTFEEP